MANGLALMANGQQQRRPPVSRIAHLPSPVGGWNALDSVTSMDPADAIRLINFFPETSYVRLRRGSALFATLADTTKPVPSLMVWASAAGEKLLAAQGTAVWDVSTGTPVNTGTAFTSDVWQWTNYSTPGGQFLIGVNGTGQQWIYNGTTWAAGVNTLGPSGSPPPNSNTFCCVAAFQQRLFFTGLDNLYLYYLPVNVFQGEIHGMDVGAFMPLGGQIACIGTWTRDDGAGGMDDVLVIVSTKGELVAYTGLNPDDPTQWSMIGRFVVGRPVAGHRQLTRLGPDMMLICEDGFQALANYLSLGTSQALKTAISRKIGNAVSLAVRANKNAVGWEGVLFPAANAIHINVPQTDGTFQQYVANSITGAWSQFTGLDARTWVRFQDGLYFGTSKGTVVQMGNFPDDQGKPIAYDMVTSFQLPGIIGTQMSGFGSMQKRATMVRPFIVTDGGTVPLLDVVMDYDVTAIGSPLAGLLGQQTAWDSFNWDQANWASDPTPHSDWYSVGGLGNAFAIRLLGSGQSNTFQVLAFDLAYEAGMGFV